MYICIMSIYIDIDIDFLIVQSYPVVSAWMNDKYPKIHIHISKHDICLYIYDMYHVYMQILYIYIYTYLFYSLVCVCACSCLKVLRAGAKVVENVLQTYIVPRCYCKVMLCFL